MKTYEQFTKPRYSCVLLDDLSSSKLKQVYCSNLDTDWTIYCHHLTISLGELPIEFKGRIGDVVELKVTAIGQDDKAYAVKIEPLDEQLKTYYQLGAKSGPKFPHITMAINTFNGGKPVMSNNIQNWEETTTDILLTGQITEIRN